MTDKQTVIPLGQWGNLWLQSVIALLVAFVAISSQSYWIDEIQTVWKAKQFNLQQWWQEMLAFGGSDLQMPLYMIYSWGWEKVFGPSEWWMRAANIPWFILGVLVFTHGRAELMIAAASSAFVWYCLDEARPYGMQLGASLLVFGSLMGLYNADKVGLFPRDSTLRIKALATGLVVLAGSSLLGMLWAAAAILIVLVALPWSRTQELLRNHWGVWLVAACGMVALTLYYIWTLQLGARASSIGTTSANNIVFILYELLGFIGLGPGRLEIRTDGIQAFRPFIIPLIVYGTVLTPILAVGLIRLWKSTSPRILLGCCWLLGGTAVVILALGYATHFRVLGRHFTPVIPIVLLCVGEGIRACWQKKTRFGQILIIGFVTLSLLSCFSFRWSAHYAKDDYRAAARFALQALSQEEVVWWSANLNGGLLYGVPVTEAEHGAAKGQVILVINPVQLEMLNQLSAPQLVVASKADLYDNRGILANYMTGKNFYKVTSLPAFTIWARGWRD